MQELQLTLMQFLEPSIFRNSQQLETKVVSLYWPHIFTLRNFSIQFSFPSEFQRNRDSTVHHTIFTCFFVFFAWPWLLF